MARFRVRAIARIRITAISRVLVRTMARRLVQLLGIGKWLENEWSIYAQDVIIDDDVGTFVTFLCYG